MTLCQQDDQAFSTQLVQGVACCGVRLSYYLCSCIINMLELFVNDLSGQVNYLESLIQI